MLLPGGGATRQVVKPNAALIGINRRQFSGTNSAPQKAPSRNGSNRITDRRPRLNILISGLLGIFIVPMKEQAAFSPMKLLV